MARAVGKTLCVGVATVHLRVAARTGSVRRFGTFACDGRVKVRRTIGFTHTAIQASGRAIA